MLKDMYGKFINVGDHQNAAKVQKVLIEAMDKEAKAQLLGQPYPGQWGGVVGGAGGGVGAAGGVGVGVQGINTQTPTPVRPYTHEERLAMRMGWGRVESSMWAPDFEHVDIHRAAGSSVVHVWVISKSGQSVVLEDDAALFPSDALVTKLTMLKG